jgi:hypothetical protein
VKPGTAHDSAGNRVPVDRVAVSERAVPDRQAGPLPRDISQRNDSTAADGQDADLDAYIARLLDAAPPLTGEQRDVLALLLRRPRRR